MGSHKTKTKPPSAKKPRTLSAIISTTLSSSSNKDEPELLLSMVMTAEKVVNVLEASKLACASARLLPCG